MNNRRHADPLGLIIELVGHPAPLKNRLLAGCPMPANHMHCPVCTACIGMAKPPEKRTPTTCANCGSFMWAEAGGREASELTTDDVIALSDDERIALIRQRWLIQGA